MTMPFDNRQSFADLHRRPGDPDSPGNPAKRSANGRGRDVAQQGNLLIQYIIHVTYYLYIYIYIYVLIMIYIYIYVYIHIDMI